MAWRQITDFAKKNECVLRVADRLGRGRGRLRVLDRVAPPPGALRPDLSKWHEQQLAAIWIGHATVLLRIGGKTLLTDPVFSNRVGIGLGVITGGPRRLVAPALTISELPTIDLVLVSHAHFDHLDRPSLDRLDKRTPVFTASRTADLIDDLGFRHVKELAWGESVAFDDLRITAQEVVHWGARTITDRGRGYNAYLIDSGKHRVLYGGDTAHGRHFESIDRVDLAILGIGGYNPYIAAHATPEQALAMADHMRAQHILPIHHSTFRLSHEPTVEPLQRMLQAAGANSNRIAVQHIGGQWAA